MLNYSRPVRLSPLSLSLPFDGKKLFQTRRKFTNSKSPLLFSRVSFVFGAITMTAGILGVPLGSYLSTKLVKGNPRCDPVICAIGLLISAPFLAASMMVVTANSALAYTFVFLGQVALNCNWAIVADMLLVRGLAMTHRVMF